MTIIKWNRGYIYIAISKRKCNQSSTRLGGLYKTVWLFWVCNETRERVYCSFRPTIYEYICRETCLQRSVFVCFLFKNFFCLTEYISYCFLMTFIIFPFTMVYTCIHIQIVKDVERKLKHRNCIYIYIYIQRTININ